MWNEIIFQEKMRELERLKQKIRRIEKRVDGVMWAIIIMGLLWMFG